MKGDGFHQRKVTNPCDEPQLALQCMKEFKQMCEKFSVRYCLWYGTALGAYRDGGFLKKDHDNDFLIILKDRTYEQILDELTPELEKLGWEKLWVNPKGQCHYFKDGILTDVWFVQKSNGRYVPLTAFGGKQTHSRVSDSWDRKHFDDLDEIDFMGCIFPIPAHIEDYFENRYEGWKDIKERLIK